MIRTIALNPYILIMRMISISAVRFFAIFMVSLIIFSLFFYIYQINKSVSEGYTVHTLQQKSKNLFQENEKLEIGLAQMGALNNIESLARELNFEEIGRIHYIQVIETQVVKK